jgi:hypothetical protein
LDTFVPLTVHVEYDGATVERQFSKEDIQRQIEIFSQITSLQNLPRVVRKPDAPKAQFRPLQPLTNATPVSPLGDRLKPITPDDQFLPSPSGSMIEVPKSNGNSN